MQHVNIGIAGAGIFGSYHANKYFRSEHAVLTVIYDRDLNRARALAQIYSVHATDNLNEFLNLTEAVVIATPAATHFFLACAALQHGNHVYVEKPLADTCTGAMILQALADEFKCILVVGHQERHVLNDLGFFDSASHDRAYIVHRSSNGAGRSGDVSVVLDLMIHDLDAICFMMKECPRILKAYGTVADGQIHSAVALLESSDGTLIKISANRTAFNAARTIDIVSTDTVSRFDLQNRSVIVMNSCDKKSTTQIKTQYSSVSDPLQESVTGFIDLIIKNNSPQSILTGYFESAVGAIEIANMIDNAILNG